MQYQGLFTGEAARFVQIGTLEFDTRPLVLLALIKKVQYHSNKEWMKSLPTDSDLDQEAAKLHFKDRYSPAANTRGLS